VKPVRRIRGGVSVLDRHDVDTDQIVPKQFLKRVDRGSFEDALFYEWRKAPGWSLPKNPILVAGRNFGFGSSREHAAWALQDYGFKAIIAPSFADIFYSNCTKIGLLPVALREQEVRGIGKAGKAEVDLEEQLVRFEGHEVSFDIDADIRRRLLQGLDDIKATLQQSDALDRYELERERSGPDTKALPTISPK
jgi:3-isopropylmalate/(R)-2-methylmalate dehydratase small subunit